MNDIEVHSFLFEDVIKSYEDDQIHGPVAKVLEDKWREEPKPTNKL